MAAQACPLPDPGHRRCWPARETARRGDRDAAIPVMRQAVDELRQAGHSSMAFGAPVFWWRRCWSVAPRAIWPKPKRRSTGWRTWRPTTVRRCSRSRCCGCARCWPGPAETTLPTGTSGSLPRHGGIAWLRRTYRVGRGDGRGPPLDQLEPPASPPDESPAEDLPAAGDEAAGADAADDDPAVVAGSAAAVPVVEVAGPLRRCAKPARLLGRAQRIAHHRPRLGRLAGRIRRLGRRGASRRLGRWGGGQLGSTGGRR